MCAIDLPLRAVWDREGLPLPEREGSNSRNPPETGGRGERKGERGGGGGGKGRKVTEVTEATVG